MSQCGKAEITLGEFALPKAVGIMSTPAEKPVGNMNPLKERKSVLLDRPFFR